MSQQAGSCTETAPDGPTVASQIKERIQKQTGLTASVGVAENKLVAKIASDLDKPDGLVIVTPNGCRAILDPLPVEVIPGIGPQTLRRLHALNITTVADLRRAPDRVLAPIFGRFARRARERAAGIDSRPVTPSRIEKSISSEETYDIDLADRADMERELLRLAEVTARRLRKASLQAGTVQVKIRQSDFQTFTRQKRLQPPACSTEQIFGVARELLGHWLESNPDARVRLLGVGGQTLSPAGQGDLFANDARTTSDHVDSAVDRIREKFGVNSVGRARTLDRP
jgi:DNA polymerase-4